jgi:hypothetical protein
MIIQIKEFIGNVINNLKSEIKIEEVFNYLHFLNQIPHRLDYKFLIFELLTFDLKQRYTKNIHEVT